MSNNFSPMQKYQKLAYLLGCYMVIVDKEINALEVAVLEDYISPEQSSELNVQKQMIFADDEEKQDISSLLSELKLTNTNTQEKKEIIQFLANVAYGDDYMAPQEKDLLFDVAKCLNIDAAPFIKEAEVASNEKVEASRLSQTKRTIGKVENILYNLIPGQKSNNTIDLLLGSLGYSASIEDITDNAIVDLDRVTKIIYLINSSLTSTNKSLNQLEFKKKNTSKEVSEVSRIVLGIKEHFDDLINNSLKENIDVLEKKRRNIRYFTIAFMGRTKAGKSTLHKVITQQENDDIGVGKLRTTRYNRSWYWNKLRIVDTPGIGAPGGAADTEIAKSIIDEADVICYVVTSDSIQETEFDFFETIKERNKPLYIVLNVKSNLTQAIRLKRFLENPTAWKETTGPQSIQGHIDRIHDRLDGKYNMDAVEIIPLHLLAAQLGFSGEHSKTDSTKLCEGSNIFSFTRSVKATVHKSGGIKKSLSIVDGTAYQVHQISLSLNQDLEKIKEGHNLLVNKRSKFNSFIKDERKKLIDDLNNIFSSVKSELRNRAAAFASENYDRNDAGKRWENDSTVKSIYSRMNTRLKQRMEDYNEKVKSQIQEIADDIQILGTFRAQTNIYGESITNTRLGVGIMGSILSAAAPIVVSQIWNPGGWILAGVTIVVGAIVSLFTSLFTSKAEKIRKATERMRDQLYSNIDKSVSENQQKYLNDVKKSLDATSNYISSLLTTYIDGTKQIIYEIETLVKQCKEGESAINSLVSFRILEFVDKQKVKEKGIRTINNNELISLYPVVRDWKQQSITYKYPVNISSKDISKITQATQMKILTK